MSCLPYYVINLPRRSLSLHRIKLASSQSESKCGSLCPTNPKSSQLNKWLRVD